MAMTVIWQIDCTPGEARRLAGLPDLMPLVELAALAQDRLLQALVIRLLDEAGAGPPGGGA